MPVLGLDYSARRLTGAQIKAAGYHFVNRYLDFPGQGWPPLTDFETADLLANGIEVHGIYEQNTNDPAGGYSAGQRMARQAVASAHAANLPRGSTIFMCSDAWLSKHGIPVSTAMSFLDGARPDIEAGGYVLGAYGFADFIFAAQAGGHADRFWLCGAEIPDAHRPEWLHMYQWNNGRVYVPHPNGLECDLNKKYLSMYNSDKLKEDDVNVYAIMWPERPDEVGFGGIPVPPVDASEPLPTSAARAFVQIGTGQVDADVYGIWWVFYDRPSELIPGTGPGVDPRKSGGEHGPGNEPVPLGFDQYTVYEAPAGAIALRMLYRSDNPIEALATLVPNPKIS